jgi:HEAT repeat protein
MTKMRTMVLTAGLVVVSAAGAMLAPRVASAAPVEGDRPRPQVQASWAPADSADALWKEGRAAIADGAWQRAATVFQRIVDDYPKSAYAPDSRYWAAYALFQIGSTTESRRALVLLVGAMSTTPNAATVKSGEARQLATRIRGQLARNGDASAAESITKEAQSAGNAVAMNAQQSRSSGRSSNSASATAMRPKNTANCPNSEENDDRIEAINALLQMNSDQAMPILKKVLARREPCTELLRKKAVFIVAQGRSDERADILLDAAKNDPDSDVRMDAVFWLSQTRSAKATDYLLQLLKTSTDTELQEKAIFALAQSGNAGNGPAQQFLRDYALKDDAPHKLRETAIFWIGQNKGEGTVSYLQQLYGKLNDDDLKDKVLFSVSQSKGHAADDWMLEQAVDSRNSMRLRKQALFWAGQGGASTAKIAALYDKGGDVEFRDQVIFALSQKSDAAAVDKLLDIAKNEKDRELRKKAIFWLGQSHDPRAVKALQALIDR